MISFPGRMAALMWPRARDVAPIEVGILERLGATLISVPDNLGWCYQDGSGTTQASSPSDSIGFVADQAQIHSNLGPELSAGAVIAAGQIVSLSPSNSNFRMSGQGIHGIEVFDAFASNWVSSGVRIFKSGDAGVRLRNSSASSIIINTSAISIRELIGMHARQSDSSRRPLIGVNQSQKKIMAFDGVDDFLATEISTAGQGWVCAGVTFDGASSQAIASTGAGTETESGVMALMVSLGSSSKLFTQASNGTQRLQANIDIPVGSPFVASMGWCQGGIFAGCNAIESAAVTHSGDFSGVAQMAIGGHPIRSTAMLRGPMSALVYCPQIPSEEDRLAIKRMVGLLQGQSL